VLVVENGERTGAEDVCAARTGRLPLDYLHVPVGNKSKALNVGVEALEPGLIHFVDDDVRVAPGGPEAYADAAGRYGPGHHFGGPVHVDRDDEPPELIRTYLPWSAVGWYHGEEEQIYDRPYFIGSNWAAYRDEVLAVGGYAEHLGPGVESGALGDEMELQHRLLDTGNHGVYLPAAPVWHHVDDGEWTIEWVRNRLYRMGVTESLLGLNQEGRGPLIAGARWGHWKECGVSGLKALIARLLRLYPPRGVDAEMRFYAAWGAVVGSRLARTRGRSAHQIPPARYRRAAADPS
jgi:hypothetical protein